MMNGFDVIIGAGIIGIGTIAVSRIIWLRRWSW
jgi:hypothetical protein